MPARDRAQVLVAMLELQLHELKRKIAAAHVEGEGLQARGQGDADTGLVLRGLDAKRLAQLNSQNSADQLRIADLEATTESMHGANSRLQSEALGHLSAEATRHQQCVGEFVEQRRAHAEAVTGLLAAHGLPLTGDPHAPEFFRKVTSDASKTEMLLEQSAAALGAKLAERRQQLLRLLRIRSQWLTGSSTPPPAVAAVGGTIGSHGSTVSSCVTSPSAPRVRQQRHASADADPPPASALPRVCKHRVRHGTSAACACSPTASSDRATAAASADGDASDAESAVTADAGASVAGVPAPAETVSPRDWDATLLAYQRDPPDGIVCLLLELLLSRRGASARACHDVVTALYAVMTRDVCLRKFAEGQGGPALLSVLGGHQASSAVCLLACNVLRRLIQSQPPVLLPLLDGGLLRLLATVVGMHWSDAPRLVRRSALCCLFVALHQLHRGRGRLLAASERVPGVEELMAVAGSPGGELGLHGRFTSAAALLGMRGSASASLLSLPSSRKQPHAGAALPRRAQLVARPPKLSLPLPHGAAEGGSGSGSGSGAGGMPAPTLRFSRAGDHAILAARTRRRGSSVAASDAEQSQPLSRAAAATTPTAADAQASRSGARTLHTAMQHGLSRRVQRDHTPRSVSGMAGEVNVPDSSSARSEGEMEGSPARLLRFARLAPWRRLTLEPATPCRDHRASSGALGGAREGELSPLELRRTLSGTVVRPRQLDRGHARRLQRELTVLASERTVLAGSVPAPPANLIHGALTAAGRRTQAAYLRHARGVPAGSASGATGADADAATGAASATDVAAATSPSAAKPRQPRGRQARRRRRAASPGALSSRSPSPGGAARGGAPGGGWSGAAGLRAETWLPEKDKTDIKAAFPLLLHCMTGFPEDVALHAACCRALLRMAPPDNVQLDGPFEEAWPLLCRMLSRQLQAHPTEHEFASAAIALVRRLCSAAGKAGPNELRLLELGVAAAECSPLDAQMPRQLAHMHWTFSVPLPLPLRKLLQQHNLSVTAQVLRPVQSMGATIEVPFMRMLAQRHKSHAVRKSLDAAASSVLQLLERQAAEAAEAAVGEATAERQEVAAAHGSKSQGQALG